jgi:hypothetical protein
VHPESVNKTLLVEFGKQRTVPSFALWGVHATPRFVSKIVCMPLITGPTFKRLGPPSRALPSVVAPSLDPTLPSPALEEASPPMNAPASGGGWSLVPVLPVTLPPHATQIGATIPAKPARTRLDLLMTLPSVTI